MSWITTSALPQRPIPQLTLIYYAGDQSVHVLDVMFGQWKHAVESTLSQHSPKPSQDGTNDMAASQEGGVRGSLDAANIRRSLSSSSQLADSALSSLRKTLALQRPASPVAAVRASPSTESQPRQRTTLEDRLKAKFAIGDASNGTSPSQSIRSTPSSTPTPVVDHPLSPIPPEASVSTSDEPHVLSPKSIPLPDSPSGSLTLMSPVPEMAHPLASVESDQPSTLSLDRKDVESHTSTQPSSFAADKHVTQDESGSSLQVQVASSSDEEPESTQEVGIEDKVLPETMENNSFDGLNILAQETDSEPVETRQQSRSPDRKADSEPVLLSASGLYAEDIPSLPEGSSGEPLQAEVERQIVQDGDPSPSASAEGVLDLGDNAIATEAPKVQLETNHEDSLAIGQSNLVAPGTAGPDIEGLQERLKLVEQRFSDVSTSFKRLQAGKAAVDRILQELTPVESITEADALRDFFQNINLKNEMAQDEIKRLNGKLTRQEERIEELRDIHRLESKSQSDQIHKLRAQLDEAEALLKVSQNSTSHLETEAAKQKAEVDRLHSENEKMKASFKDEEEKRVKAVSLLKTVRQKLVKAEKERDDATKEVQAVKQKQKEEMEKEKAERQQLQDEIKRVNAERDTAIQGLKAQFDKEIASLKDKYEKEISSSRAQYELDMITLKSLHSKETETSNARVADLETSVRILTGEKDDIFDQLQMRQAELESSQSHLESLQSQTVELQYQLRESTDRVALLTEELADSRNDHVSKAQDSAPAEEVTRLLSATEAKYEARIADLRRQMTAVERERDEGEALFSKRLAEKTKEVEQLQSAVNLTARNREHEGEIVAALQKEIENLKEASKVREQLIAELQAETGKITEVENTMQAQVAEINSKVAALEQQLEEGRARESQMRAHNKTLREELRKVQSSAALLERQRNPGVGYWAARSDGPSEQRSPTSSVTDLARESLSRPNSPSTGSTGRSEEEVNYEYLRNVILQFLEHKEMRPHLVRILSTILRFTPQETRRLIAKV